MGKLAVLVAAALAAAASARAAPSTHDYGPVFSPDGRTIAFVRTTTAGPSLMLVGADGRHLRRLVADVLPMHMSWSPDGRSLLYTAGGLWRVDLADPTPQRVTAPNPDIVDAELSPDGQSLAYSQFERCWRCTGTWIAAADGSGAQELLQGGRRLAWSPDGTRLAVSLASGIVFARDGTVLVPGSGAYAAWSPHGVYVAYTSDGLWIADVETGAKRRLTQLMGEKPAWSPDGKLIAGGTRGHVEVVRARDGRRVAVFRASSTGGGGPSWSPDGLLAFAHAGSCGIDVARGDGTGLRRITRAC